MDIRCLRVAPALLLFSLSCGSPESGQTADASGPAPAAQGELLKAPDFQLPGSDGKEYTLAQFVGKQPVVLAWFPKAFTGG